ncbi:MAG: DUF402 domain-containing protein [Kouleothrix sp.]|jgi:hypothetical protein|nr:DUF402 domain-containing protein [Kouleothrix sp.]
MSRAEEKAVQRLVEIRSFKWPYRPNGMALTRFIGEDLFGRWLGITRGDPWWSANRSHTGVFNHSFVKLVPKDTFWTACFNSSDPIVDVDIVLPVQWFGHVVEEVDLELDILRSTTGQVIVRDQDTFEHVRTKSHRSLISERGSENLPHLIDK